jgi:G3E family GTPase
MTPLAVLCGFLGAGKTSFLRKLLPELTARGLRPRVILNDYQNAKIDAALVREVAQVVEPVSGSCICCGSREELVGVLATVEPGPGQIVVVEANGTTDTEAMLEIFGAAPELQTLTPPVQLTVVDAERFGTHDWRNELERVQIRTAQHLVLSRRDLVSDERAAQVEAAARALAPGATWTVPANFAQHLATVERAERDVPTRRRAAEARFRLVPAGHAGARYHFASIEFPLEGPVDPVAFEAVLRALPPEVVRAKGIVELGAPVFGKRSFQVVDRQVEISECALFEPETLPCTAVFVGVRLPVDQIAQALRGVTAS